jgi:hypothetical protein
VTATAKPPATEIARQLGFMVRQASNEHEDLTWRWVALGRFAYALEGLGVEPSEEGFATPEDAAKGALLALTLALDDFVDEVIGKVTDEVSR